MSAFRSNNTADQSARAISPEVFVPHPEAIDSAVSSSINPAVFRGDLDAILPAEPPPPPQRKEEQEDDVIYVSGYQENCGEISFKTEAVIENIQTPPPQRKEEDDDVIFVSAYQENYRKIAFKSEAEIENIPIQTPATDNRTEERETDTENQAEEEPSRAPPPLRRLRGRRLLHKKRILGDFAFMYAITVCAYASIYRHEDL
ncbi:uncharacterized protein LOC102212601 [Pundamilia nyererei]|uniref:Uncharacterized protein LOC102212601 n=1 Tax=Pundamilia nyererei TaxID=303518 RepID=A0A9Y3V9W0_9CICH|nr:PREDICTED: uncharacterized protein LOC102212601 [Pundamilia nyererei]